MAASSRSRPAPGPGHPTPRRELKPSSRCLAGVPSTDRASWAVSFLGRPARRDRWKPQSRVGGRGARCWRKSGRRRCPAPYQRGRVGPRRRRFGGERTPSRRSTATRAGLRGGLMSTRRGKRLAAGDRRSAHRRTARPDQRPQRSNDHHLGGRVGIRRSRPGTREEPHMIEFLLREAIPPRIPSEVLHAFL